MSNRLNSVFHTLDIKSRLNILAESCGLDSDEVELLGSLMQVALKNDVNWLENQFSAYLLPLSIATGFVINEKASLFPWPQKRLGSLQVRALPQKRWPKVGDLRANSYRTGYLAT